MESPALVTPVYRLFVGVDIAAATATVACLTSDGAPMCPFTIDQAAHGFATLQQRLLAGGCQPREVLVVMEATGSYWLMLATTLAQAGFAVAIINPAQAHHFAKALLRRAKTDAIDAQTLAQLAALLRPPRWTPPPAVYHEVQQRLVQRDTLLRLRTQVTNQLHALDQHPVVVASVRQRLEELLQTLTAQIKEVEQELKVALRQDAAWAVIAERLHAIPGIGFVTAAWLLVATLNFTLCEDAEAATAYAGLAPQPYRSGTSVRKREVIGKVGNGRLRTALYLATLSATRYNPIIKAFYERLRAAGKPMKVARCAAARKLLHLAWAVATKAQPFDPAYQTRHPEVAAT